MLGPNGAGKSTLLAVLAGGLRPAQGQVALDGQFLARWAPDALARRRAVLTQLPSLQFPFSALEVVLLGRSPYAGRTTRDEDDTSAEDALRATDALHLASRLYPDLSGGERQRVHLARVLAQIDYRVDPRPGRGVKSGAQPGRYLLLDEPLGALDLAHQHALLQLARDLAARGNGILAVLHDPNLALLYAERCAVIHEGRVWGEGTPREVLDRACFREVFGVEVSLISHPAGGRPQALVHPGSPARPPGEGAGARGSAHTLAVPCPPGRGFPQRERRRSPCSSP